MLSTVRTPEPLRGAETLPRYSRVLPSGSTTGTVLPAPVAKLIGPADTDAPTIDTRVQVDPVSDSRCSPLPSGTTRQRVGPVGSTMPLPVAASVTVRPAAAATCSSWPSSLVIQTRTMRGAIVVDAVPG